MGNVLAGVQRHYAYPISVDLFVHECGECGIVFALPTDFNQRRREDGQTWYCPNGHPRVYRESELTRETKRANAATRRAEQAEEAARYQRERAQAQERSARSLKGHLTRMRRRIAAGVCPVPGCQRTGFANVMRHVASQHPDWHHEHAEELSA